MPLLHLLIVAAAFAFGLFAGKEWGYLKSKVEDAKDIKAKAEALAERAEAIIKGSV